METENEILHILICLFAWRAPRLKLTVVVNVSVKCKGECS